MKTPAIAICLILEMIGALTAAEPQSTNAPATPGDIKGIKAYCLDFNWAATTRKRAPKPFAAPGTWAGADPAAHVAWYKAMGGGLKACPWTHTQERQSQGGAFAEGVFR